MTRMVVERVDGSVVPPCDAKWSDLQQLQWKAAVIALDTGLFIEIDRAYTSANMPIPRMFSVRCGRTHATGFALLDAWHYLNGILTGAEQMLHLCMTAQWPYSEGK